MPRCECGSCGSSVDILYALCDGLNCERKYAVKIIKLLINSTPFIKLNSLLFKYSANNTKWRKGFPFQLKFHISLGPNKIAIAIKEKSLLKALFFFPNYQSVLVTLFKLLKMKMYEKLI